MKTSTLAADQVASFIDAGLHLDGYQTFATEDEIKAHMRLLASGPTVPALMQFVDEMSPGAQLRDKVGMPSQVRMHQAMASGPEVKKAFDVICFEAHLGATDPFDLHRRYESLRPFTHCNGPSGRAVWLWMMLERGEYDPARGFLAEWYRQSLAQGDKPFYQPKLAPTTPIDDALEMLEREVLDFLFEQRKYEGDELYWWVSFITDALGYPKEFVRTTLKGLKAKGLVEFRLGLFDDNGEVAGAGYCISDAGVKYLGREL